MMCKFLTFSLNKPALALLSVCALTSVHAASIDPAETDIETETAEETTGSWDQAGDSAGDAWEATKEASADTWEATKESSEEAWDATREFSADAWDATKEGSSKAWEATKEFSIDTWESTQEWFNGSESEAPVTEAPGDMAEPRADESLPDEAQATTPETGI